MSGGLRSSPNRAVVSSGTSGVDKVVDEAMGWIGGEWGGRISSNRGGVSLGHLDESKVAREGGASVNRTIEGVKAEGWGRGECG